MFFYGAIIVASAMALIARKLLPIGSINYIAYAGLFSLVTISLDLAIRWISSRTNLYLHKIYWFGLLFGCIAGLLGGSAYALRFEDDAVIDRYIRVVLISSFVGAALTLIFYSSLKEALRNRRTRSHNLVVTGLLFLLVAITVPLITDDMPRFGRIVKAISFNLVDWIGTSCIKKEDDCKTGLQPMKKEDIAVILLIYSMIFLIFHSLRARISTIVAISYSCVMFILFYLCITMFDIYSLFGIEYDAYFNRKLISIHTFAAFVASWPLYMLMVARFFLWVQRSELSAALVEAYGSLPNLQKTLNARLKDHASKVPNTGDLTKYVTALVNRAEAEGWLEELVINARFSRPYSMKLAKVADELEIGVAYPDSKEIYAAAKYVGRYKLNSPEEQLEALISGSPFLSPAEWRLALAKIENCICHIEIVGPYGGRRATGTGFLISEDLVLTCYHLFQKFWEAEPQRQREEFLELWRTVRCVFDYKANAQGVFNHGTICMLHPDAPYVDKSPSNNEDEFAGLPSSTSAELDYVLLRLERAIGNESLGANAEDGAPKRGWITLENGGTEITPNTIIWLLQHPTNQPLKASLGVILGAVENGVKIRHTASTEPGSSGSPCFDLATLAPVAMHHLGIYADDENKNVNQAISLNRISELIASRAILKSYASER